jgi:predicted transcriptional regulator
VTTFLTIYVDDITEERLRRAAQETGRSPEDLAAAAVENYVSEWARRRSRPNDDGLDFMPTRGPQPEWG